ncbi:MAG: S41 family peptidase, partial [Bacteroidaceae bacterium]
MTNKNSRLTPIIIAISIVIGILIGSLYTEHFSGNRLGIINSSSNKLNALLRIISDQYVDDVPMDQIVENAMPLILNELDPHSKYIRAEDLDSENSSLEGKFSGIGVGFQIMNDTVCINSIIPGGPSEKVGIMPGDHIVLINDSAFTGPNVDERFVKYKLKGKKGTKVKITVKRHGDKKLHSFTVTRGDIPVKSVDAAYMLDKSIGYLRISQFGRTTHMEMINSLAVLSHEGMKKVIIDLRNNSGGYMEAAVQMANEFLPKGRLIVYMEGRKYPRSEKFSNGNGSFQKIPLVVLVNEASASASEIFAGAIQDNDRGLIIGRRSFGKGLVQQPIEFNDGSAIRLTIARYYTPSGRCIQRPYSLGLDEAYEKDVLTRYEHGEFFHADSIHLDRSKTFYTTLLKRPVYAQSGIMPDIF